MHCTSSVFIPLPFLIISAASHAARLVSFSPLQAFCSSNPHSSAYCQLPAATAGPPFHLCTPGLCLPALYDSDRQRKVGCRGRRKHHLRVSPSASCEGRTARGRWPSPFIEITARMNLCSWEGKSQATALLTIFPPASSLSSFSAIGLFFEAG